MAQFVKAATQNKVRDGFITGIGFALAAAAVTALLAFALPRLQRFATAATAA